MEVPNNEQNHNTCAHRNKTCELIKKKKRVYNPINMGEKIKDGNKEILYYRLQTLELTCIIWIINFL